jgi:diguanylate cyclase (GGDEF)-like protein/PAS domain S-box-containing protein
MSTTSKIIYASPSCERLLGYETKNIVGHFLGEYLHPDDLQRMEQELSQLMGRSAESVAGLFKVRHRDGSYRVYESISTSHLDDPCIAGIVINARDVTDRLQAEAALRESQERFSLAAQGANDGLWDWNLESNQIYFSARWKNMLGYAEHEIGSNPDDWFNIIHPEDLEPFRMQLARHLAGQSGHLEVEHRMLHKNGSYVWVLCRGLAVRTSGASRSASASAASRVAGSMSDITSRKQAEAQLVHDALHDGLTGLPNRALLLDRLGRAIGHANRRGGYLFAVFFMDLDSFKLVNDSFGHDVGDKLLQAVANMLAVKVRNADTVARLGGDEFVLLLDDLQSTTEALRVAERVLEGLSQPFTVGGYTLYTSGSIGVVMGGMGYGKPEDLLRDADIAMYRAKSLGKARYVVFNNSMRKEVMTRLETERDLRRALEQEEFVLHYQPIVSLTDGRITGFEALIRWQHPTRGLLLPADFIPIAEETGIIRGIGRWVLRRACWQLRHWQHNFPEDPPLTINVNVSARQFETDDIVDEIENALDETGLQPFCLRLEITESTILEQSEFAMWVLNRLREKGVQIHVDDFGTGYSALSYLHNFPISSIKIDKSFTQRIGTGHTEIINTILAMARELGINAIAEGVETEEQLSRLKDLHCPLGQGFYISYPQDPAGIEDELSRHRVTERS